MTKFKNKFELGDKIICIDNTNSNNCLTLNKIYVVRDYGEYLNENLVGLVNDKNCADKWDEYRFELYERRIGDVWFKPHELYITPYAEPLENSTTFKCSWFNMKTNKGDFGGGTHDNGLCWEITIREIKND